MSKNRPFTEKEILLTLNVPSKNQLLHNRLSNFHYSGNFEPPKSNSISLSENHCFKQVGYPSLNYFQSYYVTPAIRQLSN